MKFLPVSAALFASLLTLVAAKDEIRLPNSFIVPAPGEVLKAGTEYTVRWIADTKGKVKLVLRKGPSTDLDTLGLIAEVENKGSYLWAIDEDLESGTVCSLPPFSSNVTVILINRRTTPSRSSTPPTTTSSTTPRSSPSNPTSPPRTTMRTTTSPPPPPAPDPRPSPAPRRPMTTRPPPSRP